MYSYANPKEVLQYTNNKEIADHKRRLLETYEISSGKLKTKVEITARKRLTYYNLLLPEIGIATVALIRDIKERILSSMDLSSNMFSDPQVMKELRNVLAQEAGRLLQKELLSMKPELKDHLIQILINDTLGLGDMEFLLNDNYIEEIVINSVREPVRVYHKKYGWMNTNIQMESENDTLDYAHMIARQVGREITTLNPRLDAYLSNGDRVNATLNPISIKGHTITIRKFVRDPWTATDMIRNRTISSEAMALIWLAMQYEMNIIISGGTASGKTSFLNTCMPFIQPNHRIISIEDTKELQLPDFLYWCPLLTREPNHEGKGEVTMLDLLVNTMRMRPDRIIVGEIRKQREAEVLFEAMHTGHSVYATLHADTCAQTISRLTNPPISIPHSTLDSVHLNVVMFRDRRRGFRRVFEMGEFVPRENKGTGDVKYYPKIIYKWSPKNDVLGACGEEIRLYEKISSYTELSTAEVMKDIETKREILEWLVKNNVRQIEDFGKFMNYYYIDTETVLSALLRRESPWKLIEGNPEDIG